MRGTASGVAAIGAQCLRIDPASFRPGQEGNHVGDIVGRTQPLHRCELPEPVDLLRRLAFEEQIGGGRARRDRVDADAAPAQLMRQDAREHLDRGFGGRVGSVAREAHSEDAGGHGDDAAAIGEALCRLLQHIEGAAHVDVEDRIEVFDLARSDREELHDAGAVDDDANLAVRLLGAVEQPRHAGRVGDIRLHRDGAAAPARDLLDHLGGLVSGARIVDDDGKAISREPQCHGAADAARSASDDRMLRRGVWRSVTHPNFSCS